ncbi:MAG: hypothetical protein V7635_2407 [Arthrobacter sp.]|jgi:hypothetical protein
MRWGNKVPVRAAVSVVPPGDLGGGSEWGTLRLACAVKAPLYLYYGESGEPSTFDPAGNPWNPAHSQAGACTFEGKIYGSEP